VITGGPVEISDGLVVISGRPVMSGGPVVISDTTVVISG